ncbi:hypothetical protein D3C78_1649490 [compost metagenome]
MPPDGDEFFVSAFVVLVGQQQGAVSQGTGAPLVSNRLALVERHEVGDEVDVPVLGSFHVTFLVVDGGMLEINGT